MVYVAESLQSAVHNPGVKFWRSNLELKTSSHCDDSQTGDNHLQHKHILSGPDDMACCSDYQILKDS